VLNFPVDQTTVDKKGESLVFNFADGSSIEIENFYTHCTGDNIPAFEADGQLIAGAEFFTAFAPDIAPAAGGNAVRGGHYQEYDNADLTDGINHLNGLDWGMDLDGQDISNRQTFLPPMPEEQAIAPSVPVPPPLPVVSVVTDALTGKGAITEEGGNLVFAVRQSEESASDTTVDWTVTLPETGATGQACIADFDIPAFEAAGIALSRYGNEWTLSGTVTIPAGDTGTNIVIPTRDDAVFEGNEDLTLILSNPNGAQLPDNKPTAAYEGLIYDNDGPPVVSVVTDALTGKGAATEEGGDLVFAVSQSVESASDTTVDWTVTLPETGAAGQACMADFDLAALEAAGIAVSRNGDEWTLSGTVTIPAGDTGTNIVIPTRDDAVFEGDEDLTLVLSNPTGGAQLPDNKPTADYEGLIYDNDAPVVSVVTDALTGKGAATEEGGDLVFAVSQSLESASDTTVDWTVTLPETGAAGLALLQLSTIYAILSF
jgi:hypothetical protein